MKYKIENGGIFLEDEKYCILSTELNHFNIEILDSIIRDMENVLNGIYEASSFSDIVSIVSFDRDSSTIEDYENIIGEESTIDIYNMLLEFRKELKRLKGSQSI